MQPENRSLGLHPGGVNVIDHQVNVPRDRQDIDVAALPLHEDRLCVVLAEAALAHDAQVPARPQHMPLVGGRAARRADCTLADTAVTHLSAGTMAVYSSSSNGERSCSLRRSASSTASGPAMPRRLALQTQDAIGPRRPSIEALVTAEFSADTTKDGLTSSSHRFCIVKHLRHTHRVAALYHGRPDVSKSTYSRSSQHGTGLLL
jgi:hypothetical protein